MAWETSEEPYINRCIKIPINSFISEFGVLPFNEIGFLLLKYKDQPHIIEFLGTIIIQK